MRVHAKTEVSAIFRALLGSRARARARWYSRKGRAFAEFRANGGAFAPRSPRLPRGTLLLFMITHEYAIDELEFVNGALA